MTPRELQQIYRHQARWFAGERSRLLRKAGIHNKRAVLDLGCGTGEVLPELARRAGGQVFGVDSDPESLSIAKEQCDVPLLTADAAHLPFSDETIDLVFTQMFFLWITSPEHVLTEIRRVLMPGGHLVLAAEPDYGGAIEHPSDEGRLDALVQSLKNEGADVHMARKLGHLLENAGFDVTCGVHPVRPLDAARADPDFDVPELYSPSPSAEFLFVPYFHFLGIKV